jgi:hypothetical protein
MIVVPLSGLVHCDIEHGVALAPAGVSTEQPPSGRLGSDVT